MAEQTSVLQLDAVCKSYNVGTPVEVEVLHDVDLALGEGEFVALTGPSGSGKSTLLNIVGLLDRATKGKLFIEGRETSKLPEAEITKLRGHSIGFVFQYHCLISAFTAIENVMMPLLVEKAFPSEAMHARARELLAQVGLTQWENSLVNNLSGGQQQRVAIARALAMNPALILADEPTGNLDSKSANSVFDMMQEVNQTNKTTFLMVTHNMQLAQRCQRIVEVVDGRVTGARRA